MSPEELKTYAEAMRELGVITFKSPEIEITLGAPPTAARQEPEGKSPLPKRNEYESLLFAATEGLPDDDSE